MAGIPILSATSPVAVNPITAGSESTSAGPASTLTHRMIANCATVLVRIEKSCHIHIMMNFLFQSFIITELN